MIHTVYSNAYEVLRLVLLHNLDEMNRDEAGLGLFDTAPILVPSKAIGTDLSREIARRHGICSGWEFVNPGEWMGFFAKAPMANVVGNEAEWMIWRILRDTSPGCFRSQPGHERLQRFLAGKNDEAIYQFARRLVALFVVYASYRADWVFRWLGVAEEILGDPHVWAREEDALFNSLDYDWQRHLWERLAENPYWKGQKFLENFVKNLETLATSANVGGITDVILDEDRHVKLPQTLHVFMPFVLPPLMLPVFKALALSGRDIWFYVLNPSSAYWFDSASAVRHHQAATEAADGNVGEEGEEAGDSLSGAPNIHPLLLADAGAMRANIDRLWQFTQEPDTAPLLSDRSEAAEAPVPAKQITWDVKRFNTMAQRLTLDMDMESERVSYYIERQGTTLLSRIQDSLLTNDTTGILREDGRLMDDTDQSLRFWNAPNETRQWEAVADAIETLFAKDKTLTPSDILVVTPDVTAAAPLIDKVFGSIPKERRFPWRLTGVAPIATEEVAQAIAGLTTLMTTRADRESLEAWLALPPVAKRFGLTSDELGLVNDWLQAAGYQAGLSIDHLRTIDRDVFDYDADMNLMSAIGRLTVGYTMPDDEGLPLLGLLPRHGNEQSSYRTVHDRPDLLETLQTIALTLEDFRLQTLEDKPAAEWAQWLMRAVNTFLESPDEWRGVKSALKELLRELSLAADDPTEQESGIRLSFALFMHALQGKMEVSAGMPAPGADVTISSMEALRGLPYRVVFIVGLDADCGFPGTMAREEFDLMLFAPRRGDRDSRRDRRNLFLDWILAARDQLIVTYVTSSKLSEAEVMQPSIVVQELRDWLLDLVTDEDIRLAEGKRLTEMLPLNAYSLENFLPGPSLWLSHDEEAIRARRAVEAGEWLPTVGTIITSPVSPVSGVAPGWSWETWKKGEPPLELPLSVLGDFVRSPEKWLAKAAGFFPPSDPEAREESIWPERDSLKAWQLRRDFIDALKAHESARSILRRREEDPTAGARTARGWLEKEDFSMATKTIVAYQNATYPWKPLPAEHHRLPLLGGAVVLTGTLTDLYHGVVEGLERLPTLEEEGAKKTPATKGRRKKAAPVEEEVAEETSSAEQKPTAFPDPLKILAVLSASSHYGADTPLRWVFANAVQGLPPSGEASATAQLPGVALYAVHTTAPKKPGEVAEPESITLPPLTPQRCRTWLEEAVKAFLAACQEPTRAVHEETQHQGYAMLFGETAKKGKRYEDTPRQAAHKSFVKLQSEEKMGDQWTAWWSVLKPRTGTNTTAQLDNSAAAEEGGEA